MYADLLAGDILAFSGRGFVSTGIRFTTCSKYSHVGIMADWKPASTTIVNTLLFESTTESNQCCVITDKHVEGVQAVNAQKRIGSYDGRVWVLRMKDFPRQFDFNSQRLTAFLLDYIGKDYDAKGAVLSGFRRLYSWSLGEDLRTMFCSELAYAALEAANALPEGNASRVPPSRLVRYLLRSGKYNKPEKLK